MVSSIEYIESVRDAGVSETQGRSADVTFETPTRRARINDVATVIVDPTWVSGANSWSFRRPWRKANDLSGANVSYIYPVYDIVLLAQGSFMNAIARTFDLAAVVKLDAPVIVDVANRSRSRPSFAELSTTQLDALDRHFDRVTALSGPTLETRRKVLAAAKGFFRAD